MDRLKTSAGRLYTVYFMCVLAGIFTYMTIGKVKTGVSDILFIPVIFAVVNLLLPIPMYLYIKKHRNTGILEHTGEASRAYSVILAVIYAVVFFFILWQVLARFELFSSSVMFPETDMRYFVVVFAFAAATFSIYNLGPVSRSSVIFTIVIVFSTVVLFINAISEMNSVNFTKPFDSGIADFIKNDSRFGFYIAELSAVPLFLKSVSGNIKKSTLIWLIASCISIFIIAFIIVGTLGSFADTRLFPVYTSSMLGGRGIFGKLDSIVTSVWLLSVTIKVTFMFVCINKCISHIFPKANMHLIPFITAAAVSLFLIFFTDSIKFYGIFSKSTIMTVAYILTVTVIPLTALFIKGKRNNQ